MGIAALIITFTLYIVYLDYSHCIIVPLSSQLTLLVVNKGSLLDRNNPPSVTSQASISLFTSLFSHFLIAQSLGFVFL